MLAVSTLHLPAMNQHKKAERVPLFLEASVAANLQRYRDFYRKTYRDSDISTSALVEAILRDFMAEDKAFQQFLAGTTPGPKRD